MPPVAKSDQSTLRKDVEFVAKDDDEQIAAGIVMVPDAADLQRDFAREETIHGFADQFETFEAAGESGNGVMHAVFPDEHAALERNEVLGESEEIGGQTVDAGAWVQEWRIEDENLWGLVTDGILSGYSIGAVDVRWDGPYEQDADEVSEISTPEEIGDDPIWELTDGIIREVSVVDIPAVPDAQILETKADAEKRLGDYLGNRDGFMEEAQERGHSEDEAGRLWDYLNDAVELEGSGEPGEKTLFHRIGKAAVDTFLGGDTPTRETSDVDPRKSADDDPDEDEDEDEPDDDDDDPDGDTSDDSTDMSNDSNDNTDPMADAPEWAKALNGRIDDLETDKDADADDPLADAPEWAKGLADRVDEIEEKTLDDDIEDKPEWAKELEARIDRISQQSGVSTQLENAAGEGGEGDDEDGLGGLGKALS